LRICVKRNKQHQEKEEKMIKTPAQFINDNLGEKWVGKNDWLADDVHELAEDYAKYYHTENIKEEERIWRKISEVKSIEKDESYNKLPKPRTEYDIVVKGEIIYRYYYGGSISDDRYVEKNVEYFRFSQILKLPVR